MCTITKIEFKKIEVPLKNPFIISLGAIYAAENVVVRISTDTGLIGYGECSPFLTINGETADTCIVVANLLQKIFVGKNPLDIEQRVSEMDEIIYGNHSIKSAFDMALYDIASQNANQPLYEFIGGKNNKIIKTDYTVSIGSPEEMANQAKEIVANDFEIIKVKLGKNGVDDVERIRAIRNAVGMEIPIRIDANQGWEVEESIVTLNAMNEFNIQHCEEPIPRWNFMALPYIKKNISIPLMADESCCNVYDAQRLIYLNAVDLFNIKLGKTGGIFNALKIIRLAEEKNIKVQIGAFLESRLAMTAIAHFALSSDCIVFYDLDTSLMFSKDYVNGGIKYGNHGEVFVDDKPGIGATMESAFE